jgi:hypothetical protein
VFLRNGFKAEKEVRLLGAEIGGEVDCTNSQFSDPNGKALNADGIKVARGVRLGNGFKAEGEVRLLGAEIGGEVDCENGQFINPEGDALNGQRIKVADCVLLRTGFKVQGRINLAFANIGHGLACNGIDSTAGMTLDVRAANVGTFRDGHNTQFVLIVVRFCRGGSTKQSSWCV